MPWIFHAKRASTAVMWPTPSHGLQQKFTHPSSAPSTTPRRPRTSESYPQMPTQGKKRARGEGERVSKAPKMRRSVSQLYFWSDALKCHFFHTKTSFRFLRARRFASTDARSHPTSISTGALALSQTPGVLELTITLLLPLVRPPTPHQFQCDACACAKRKCDGEARCSLCTKKDILCMYSEVRDTEKTFA